MQSAAAARPWAWAAAFGVVGLAALALRVQGLTSELWFDEAWSVRFALRADGLRDIYAHAAGNNHLLNTIAIHWIGPRDGWLAYRALAFASGLVALALAVLEPGLSMASRLVRGILLGVSPLLVLLSTEARGYAPAIAAALASLWLLRAWLDRGGRARLLGFDVLLLLGLASHLVFVHVYVAAFVYAAVRLHGAGLSLRAQATRLAQAFAFPALMAVLHGALFVARLRLGGAPPVEPGRFLESLVAFTFGVPQWDAARALAALLGIAGFASHLRRLRARGDARWAFDLTLVVASPAFFLVFFYPGAIAPRYFALQIVFLLIALADELAARIESGGASRAFAVGVVAALVAGSATYHARSARFGRGGYLEAVRAMARLQPGDGPVTVSADHEFRAFILLDYYQAFVDRPIRLIGRPEDPEHRAGWHIVHDLRPDGPPPPRRIAVVGEPYVLHARYDFGYLSGFQWDLYRRERNR